MESFLYAIDWVNTWRPASLLLLSGQSPYLNKWFFGPPWALFPLLPLAVLPETIGRVILFALCLILFALAAVRLGARPPALAIFLLSPPVVHSLSTGNLDSFVLFGAALGMPPLRRASGQAWLGLFFVSIKPQIGLPLALLWAVEACRAGGVKQALRTFAPVTIALLLSFILYGPWPIAMLHSGQAGTSLVDRPWNASLWPWSILPGLALVALALVRHSTREALAAGPFLSPYLSFQSYAASLVALARRPWLMLAASAALWALTIWQIISR